MTTPFTPLPPCREVLDRLLDRMGEYHLQHGRKPYLIHLPIRDAYAICKGTRDDIGADALAAVFVSGVVVFEEIGLFGSPVRIDKTQDAELRLE